MPAGASATNYDPRTWKLLTYHDAVARFLDGSDSPRAYLERSLEAIEAREDDIMAWAFLDSETARASADKATERYRTARPLSPVDGLPIGIKDLMTTFDMPTEYGSVLYKDHRPLHDAACVDALRQGGAVLVGKTVTITFGGGDAGPEPVNDFETASITIY